MKLYDAKALPNPRRVRIFLAEKGVNLPFEEVDVLNGENRKPEFLKRNPDATVPLLELADGNYLSETIAISRYFEELYPDKPLMGAGAEEKAAVEMWQRRVEHSLLNTLIAYFHHATEGFGDKARYRNKEWGLHNRERFLASLDLFDMQLGTNSFIAGENYSIADITALCAIDLAKALHIDIPEKYEHLNAWYIRVSQRESAAA